MSLLDDAAKAFLQIHLLKTLASSFNFDIGVLSIGDAYEVQRRVIAARVARGEQVVGYKVGCTSTAIRRHSGHAGASERLASPPRFMLRIYTTLEGEALKIHASQGAQTASRV